MYTLQIAKPQGKGNSMVSCTRSTKDRSLGQILLSALLSLVLLCSLAPIAQAAEYDDLFDDPGFAQAFYDDNGETKYDGNPWTYADLASMTDLSLYSTPIGSFSDLQHFPSLISLSIADCSIDTIGADFFAHNPNLIYLGLNNDNISSLHVNAFADLPNLQNLSLERNRLMDVPAGLFDNNPKLRGVYLYGNSLTSLPDNLFSVPFADFMSQPGYNTFYMSSTQNWIQTSQEDARKWFDASGTVVDEAQWTSLIDSSTGLNNHRLYLSLSSDNYDPKDKPVAMETDFAVSGGDFMPVAIGDATSYDSLDPEEREIALSLARMLWNYDTDMVFSSTASMLFDDLAGYVGPGLDLYDAFGRTDVPLQYVNNLEEIFTVAGWALTTDLSGPGSAVMTPAEWQVYEPLIRQSLDELSLDAVLAMTPSQLLDYVIKTVLTYTDPQIPVTSEMIAQVRAGILADLNDVLQYDFGLPPASSVEEALDAILGQVVPAPGYQIDFSASVDSNAARALSLFVPVDGKAVTGETTKAWLINAINLITGMSFTPSTDFLTVITALSALQGDLTQYPFMYLWNIGLTSDAHTVSATPKFDEVDFLGARMLSRTPGGSDTALEYTSASGTHSVTHQPQNMHDVVAFDFRYTGDLTKHFNPATIANTDEEELRSMTHYVFTDMSTPTPTPTPTPIPTPTPSNQLAKAGDATAAAALMFGSLAIAAVGIAAFGLRRRKQDS